MFLGPFVAYPYDTQARAESSFSLRFLGPAGPPPYFERITRSAHPRLSAGLARYRSCSYPADSSSGKRTITNRDRILALLRTEPGLTDREICERMETPWHSMVNQECHTLEGKDSLCGGCYVAESETARQHASNHPVTGDGASQWSCGLCERQEFSAPTSTHTPPSPRCAMSESTYWLGLFTSSSQRPCLDPDAFHGTSDNPLIHGQPAVVARRPGGRRLLPRLE